MPNIINETFPKEIDDVGRSKKFTCQEEDKEKKISPVERIKTSGRFNRCNLLCLLPDERNLPSLILTHVFTSRRAFSNLLFYLARR